MSGHTIVERFQLTGYVASMVVREVNRAFDNLMDSAKWSLISAEHASRGEDNLSEEAARMSEIRKASAISSGHVIREVIQRQVRLETAIARELVGAGKAQFLQPACATDSCSTCKHPTWHHIRLDGGRVLCPKTRQYWQIARALMPNVMGEDRSDDRLLLSIIAATK